MWFTVCSRAREGVDLSTAGRPDSLGDRDRGYMK